MARVKWTQQALDDLDNIASYLLLHNASNVAEKVSGIIKAVDILELNPLLGHAVQQGRRELLVGHRRSTYKVHYRYLHDIDTAFIVSVRSHKQV